MHRRVLPTRTGISSTPQGDSTQVAGTPTLPTWAVEQRDLHGGYYPGTGLGTILAWRELARNKVTSLVTKSKPRSPGPAHWRFQASALWVGFQDGILAAKYSLWRSFICQVTFSTQPHQGLSTEHLNWVNEFMDRNKQCICSVVTSATGNHQYWDSERVLKFKDKLTLLNLHKLIHQNSV